MKFSNRIKLMRRSEQLVLEFEVLLYFLGEMDEWQRLLILRKTPVNILQRQACSTEVTGVHTLLASQLSRSFAQFQTSVFVNNSKVSTIEQTEWSLWVQVCTRGDDSVCKGKTTTKWWCCCRRIHPINALMMSVTTFTQEEVTRSTNIKAFLRTWLFINQQSSTQEGKRGVLAALCMMCNPEVCEQNTCRNHHKLICLQLWGGGLGTTVEKPLNFGCFISVCAPCSCRVISPKIQSHQQLQDMSDGSGCWQITKYTSARLLFPACTINNCVHCVQRHEKRSFCVLPV